MTIGRENTFSLKTEPGSLLLRPGPANAPVYAVFRLPDDRVVQFLPGSGIKLEMLLAVHADLAQDILDQLGGAPSRLITW